MCILFLSGWATIYSYSLLATKSACFMTEKTAQPVPFPPANRMANL